jgi:hypothetical protein
MNNGVERLGVEATTWQREQDRDDRTIKMHCLALTARLRSQGLLDEEMERVVFALAHNIADLDNIRDLEMREKAHMDIYARLTLAIDNEDIVAVFLRYAGIDPADFDEKRFAKHIEQLAEKLEFAAGVERALEAVIAQALINRGVATSSPRIEGFIENFIIDARILLTRDRYTAIERQNQREEWHARINRQRLPRVLHHVVDEVLSTLEQVLGVGPQA